MSVKVSGWNMKISRLSLSAACMLMGALSAEWVCAQTSLVNDRAVPTAYMKAADAPAYKSASAHDPHYEDAKLWPPDSKKSYYARQVWPKGRLWVWAKPGLSMNEGGKPLEPKNWLEDGKLAMTPCDADTDFDFPSAPNNKAYYVNLGGNKSQVTWRRHLTINAGANISWLHGARGNTWIKKGGSLMVLSYIGGDKDAFIRNDNDKSWWMVDHFYFSKEPKASIEVIGPFSVDDSFHFNSGMTILAEGSIITPQARCTLNVQENATLVLLSGATYRKQANQTFGCDLIVRGKLMAGLPERPLTSDCFLGLSWKGKARFQKVEGWRVERADDVALIVMPAIAQNIYSDKGGWQNIPRPAGSLKVYSTDPAKARLVLDWNGLEIGGETKKGGMENYEKLSQLKEHFVEIYLLGNVELNGVLLNHIGLGGIIVENPTDFIQSRNITWGKDNAGTPAELLKKWDGKKQSLFDNSKDF